MASARGRLHPVADSVPLSVVQQRNDTQESVTSNRADGVPKMSKARITKRSSTDGRLTSIESLSPTDPSQTLPWASVKLTKLPLVVPTARTT